MRASHFANNPIVNFFHHDEEMHSHDHEHSHDGECGGHHHSAAPALNTKPSPAPFLLKHTLEHNIHHVEELQKLAAQLKVAGFEDSAEAVARAVDLYIQGNEELADAVAKLSSEQG